MTTPDEGAAVSIPESDFESLSILLYGAWEDEGLLQEQQRLASQMENDDDYGNDRKAQVAERIAWMNDFYQRVVLPWHQKRENALTFSTPAGSGDAARKAAHDIHQMMFSTGADKPKQEIAERIQTAIDRATASLREELDRERLNKHIENLNNESRIAQLERERDDAIELNRLYYNTRHDTRNFAKNAQQQRDDWQEEAQQLRAACEGAAQTVEALQEENARLTRELEQARQAATEADGTIRAGLLIENQLKLRIAELEADKTRLIVALEGVLQGCTDDDPKGQKAIQVAEDVLEPYHKAMETNPWKFKPCRRTPKKP